MKKAKEFVQEHKTAIIGTTIGVVCGGVGLIIGWCSGNIYGVAGGIIGLSLTEKYRPEQVEAVVNNAVKYFGDDGFNKLESAIKNSNN